MVSARSDRTSRPRRRALVRALTAATLLASVPVLIAARPDPTSGPSSAAAVQSDGQRVYSQSCSACHQASGEGVAGVFPPLVDSEWVTGDKGRLVRIIMHGLTGPISVAGEEYEGMMPPWGGTLGDAEIAAVATYVRSSWGNEADAVSVAEVTAIRTASAARTTPWTAEELMASASPAK